MRNLDVLFWEDTVNSRSLCRVLEKYPDLTLFTQNTAFAGFIPDVVVLTTANVYEAVKVRLAIVEKYPDVPIAYIRDSFDPTSIGCVFTAGIEYVITTDTSSGVIHKFLQTIGFTAKISLTKRHRSSFLIKQFSFLNDTQFTFKELAILGASVRAISSEKLAKYFSMSEVDVNYIISTICKKLGIKRKELKTVDMIRKYGAISAPDRCKKYKIRATHKTAGYYVIPQIYEEDW